MIREVTLNKDWNEPAGRLMPYDLQPAISSCKNTDDLASTRGLRLKIITLGALFNNFKKLTLRNLSRHEGHGGSDQGEEGDDLEGLHGAAISRNERRQCQTFGTNPTLEMEDIKDRRSTSGYVDKGSILLRVF